MSSTSRRWWWLCILSAAWFPSSAAADNPPNFLLIMVDDLGPEWIGCYGADGIETPRIDDLAATGMRMDAAYSMPKCTPTRVTLLTGQYPFRHGWVNHWDVPRWGVGCHFDPGHYTTFAGLLREAGYATAIAGKWQINDFRVQPDVLDAHGFDRWCMWTGWETGVEASQQRYWDPYLHTNDGSRTWTGRFSADVFVDFLIEFMAEHRERPMLLYYPMVLTHGPLTSTPDEPDVEGNLPKHRAMVRYVDRAVGRLVDALEELGIREQTFVIFTTDNGTSRGIRGSINGRDVAGGKGLLLETGCRAPLIVNRPGSVPTGTVSGALTDFTDFLPTFCELAGKGVPERMEIDGVSQVDVWLGQDSRGRRDWVMSMGGGEARIDDFGRIVPEHGFAPRAVRQGPYKLIIGADRQPRELFDLISDPAELTNLLNGDDPDARHSLVGLQEIVEGFPDRDAAPQYDPTPRQAWDRNSGRRVEGRE